jgi:Uma2 family endonuclease
MHQLHPLSPAQTLPTMYDLPSEDPQESGLPDQFHEFQPRLLRETCQPNITDEIFVGVDLNLYYDSRHTNWYKRPDWFLVLGVEQGQHQTDLRLSYVIWQEAVAPFLVVELLSPGTEAEDLGQSLREFTQPPSKWQVYQEILRVPYYVVFDRYSNRFRLFRLSGFQYQEVELTEERFWFDELGLGLGVYQGVYAGIEGRWLRWYDLDRQWVPSLTEQVEQSESRFQQAESRIQQAESIAQQERQRADKLAAQLRELGIEPG